MSQSRNLRRTSLSAATFAGDRRSRLGLFGSAALHAAVIAATLFTWQHSLKIADESPPVVPVDLVTIGEKTNIAPMAPKEDFKPPKEDTAVTAPEVDQKTPPPEKMATPDLDMAPPPEPAPSEALAKPVPARVMPKQRPRPPEEKKQKFDVNNILALLDKQKPAASAARGKAGPRAIKGIGDQTAMTMDLVDALRNQIAQCWSPPVGAPHPENLIVSFELYLNPDGSVARPPQLAGESTNGGAYMRAAEEAARRAIYTCAPYRLPAERYSQWRDITLVFDPRKMVGQ